MQKEIKQCFSLSVEKGQYSYTKQQREQNIEITIQTQQEHKRDIQVSILSQIRFQALKNPTKYKPKELSQIRLNVVSYESQDMKIQKHFKNSFLDQEQTSNIVLYLHIYHFELFDQSDEFKRYLLDAYMDSLRITLKPPNIIELQGQLKLSEIQSLKKTVQTHISKTIVLKWKRLSSNQNYHNLKQSYPQRKQDYLLKWNPELKSIQIYFDKVNQHTYYYTKDQKEAQECLKILTNLEQKTINLQDDIFKSTDKLILFKLFYLEEIIKRRKKLQIIIDQNNLIVFGQIPDILEFERILHFKYTSMIVKKIQVQTSGVRAKVIDKYIAISELFTQQGSMPKQNSKFKQNQKQIRQYLSTCHESLKSESFKYVFIMKEQNFILKNMPLNILQITLVSYELDKIQNVQSSIYNQFDSIVHKIISTGFKLTSGMVNQRNQLAKTKVDVIIQQDNIIVSGFPRDVQLFEKPFKMPIKQTKKQIAKKKSQTLRQLNQSQFQAQYTFKMNSAVAIKFQTKFFNQIVINAQQVQGLWILQVKIPQQVQDLRQLQKQILQFFKTSLVKTQKHVIHSQYSSKIEHILQINKQVIDTLSNWKIDYRLIRQIKKIHIKQYQYIYLQSKLSQKDHYIWKEVSLPIEQIETIILSDMRSLAQWNYGLFKYEFSTGPINIQKTKSNCLLLAKTFKKQQTQQTIKLNKFQFLLQYVIKLNSTAVKIIKKQLKTLMDIKQ